MTTNAGREAHQIRFSPHDYMDVLLHRIDDRLIGFTLNYRAKTRTGWKEVIRYDTHHGRLHIHRFWRPPGRQIEYLEKETSDDYEVQFKAAEAEIRRNWQRFRRLIEDRD